MMSRPKAQPLSKAHSRRAFPVARD
jgi:hypothetical protein